MKGILTLICIVYCSVALCQLTTFQKIYGGSFVDYCYSVRPTSDGAYVMTGATTSFGNNSDIYLIKVDSYGSILWTRRYFDSNNGRGRNVWQTADSGYIIAGLSYMTANYNLFMVKTDSIGILQWYTLFDGSAFEDLFSVIQTADGGYIATGYTNTANANDILLIKTDVNGNLLWSKTFGGTLVDGAYTIRQTSDAGFLVAGSTESFGAGAGDVYVIKTDSTGNYAWSKTYGTTGGDEALAMELTSDGGFITAGTTYDSLSGMASVYVIKSDSSGNVQWSKSYGNSSSSFTGTSIQPTSDGGYIIADTSDGDAGLIKIDSTGTLIWANAYGTAGYEYVFSASEATDGGYVTGGWTDSYSIVSDIYFVKTDSNGNCVCLAATVFPIVTTPATQVTSPPTVVNTPAINVFTPIVISGTGGTATTICATANTQEILNNQQMISVYPNPFNTSTTIQIYDLRFTKYDFALYDLTGREVFVTELLTPVSQLERSDLQSGIYFYKVTRDKGQGTMEIIGTGKIIIE